MSDRLKNRVAIITGGAGGIGAACVRRFVEEDGRVVIADVDEQRGAALAEELGPNAVFEKHNVVDEDNWRSLTRSTVDRWGALHILVNCAGYGIQTNIENTTLEQWREMFAVNTEGPFLGCKYSFPEMLRSGIGSIINISSCAAAFGYATPMPYAAAKAAMTGLTLSIAAHCRDNRYPIRANIVMPGSVDTPLLRAAIKNWGADMEAPKTKAYIASLGQPLDMANPILFLASDEARYINGETLLVDGGKDRSGVTHQSRVL